MRDDEVRRRLPEVSFIEDDDLQAKTLDACGRGIPDYFWDVPATSSGKYHNPYARNEHGLWIHTKMAVTAFQRMRESLERRDMLTDTEADCVVAALLLHDMLKYGHEYSEGDSTASNDDVLSATWVRTNTELPSVVPAAIESHMGPWGEGPEPQTALQEVVHRADMTASTANVTCGVYGPAEEITDKYPDIPRVNV